MKRVAGKIKNKTCQTADELSSGVNSHLAHLNCDEYCFTKAFIKKEGMIDIKPVAPIISGSSFWITVTEAY